MLFFLMIGVLLVLGILALSLNFSMGEKTQFINGHSNSLLLDMAAMEVTSQVYSAIGSELCNPKSPLFVKILKARIEDFPLAISPVWPTSFAFQNRADIPKISCSIQGRINDGSPLENGAWKDPWEKFFAISIQIELSIRSGTLHKMTKLYKFSRLGKIHSLALPIVSKFTLFIKSPEPTDEKSAGYNCFRSTIDGKALTPNDMKKGVEAPLILCNSSENKMTDLKKAGFIFLGGDKDVELHLTNGADSTFGESFHFFPITKSEGKSPLYDLTFLPDSFQKPLSLSSGTVQGKMGIQQTFFGFYDQDNSSPPNSMNIDGSLGYFFDRISPRTMDSSCIHLFGTIGNPSPALVFGKVSRVFAVFSGLTLDLDQDGRPEGLLSLLKQPLRLQTLTNAEDLWNLVSLPTSFLSRKTQTSYELDPSTTMKTIFGTPYLYFFYASTLVSEPFNRGYECLTNEKGDFPPAGKFKEWKFPGESAEVPFQFLGSNFEIRVPQAESCFKLNLDTLSTKDILTHRINETVESQKEFLERFVKDGSLDMKGNTVLVTKGDLELPANLEVANPGIIVVKKDIHLKGDLRKKDKKTLLTLVSSEGNIILDSVNADIQAYLVAIEGSVFPSRKSYVKIFGGVAVKTLEPANWKAGGTITYDTEFDFTQENREENYSAAISDYYSEWDMGIAK
ncbi:MAG: hypothetical protein WA705_27260 [Candidatus Ozemobacteraceae bacterium]